jgi:hypothetical protein
MARNSFTHLQIWFTAALLTLTDHVAGAMRQSDDDSDRGDVPGWVMITMMTAIVVIALLTAFRAQVLTAVKNAFDSVSGAGKT